MTWLKKNKRKKPIPVASEGLSYEKGHVGPEVGLESMRSVSSVSPEELKVQADTVRTLNRDFLEQLLDNLFEAQHQVNSLELTHEAQIEGTSAQETSMGELKRGRAYLLTYIRYIESTMINRKQDL